jgi:hypothetical protein
MNRIISGYCFFLKWRRLLVVASISNTLFLFVFFISNTSNGQLAEVYIDGGINFNNFVNTTDFQMTEAPVHPLLRLGFGLYPTEDKDFSLKGELGFSRRGFDRNLSGANFTYRFTGVDLIAMAEYRVWKELRVEVGIGAYFYITIFQENGAIQDLGEGFNSFDFQIIPGLNYRLYEGLFLGTRLRYGAVPMLDYSPVGDFGQLDGSVHIVNQLSPEVFLRVKIFEDE